MDEKEKKDRRNEAPSPSDRDVFAWPDGYWCYRGEYSSHLRADRNYKLIAVDSPEWLSYAAKRRPAT
jgi:hypothetical protein